MNYMTGPFKAENIWTQLLSGRLEPRLQKKGYGCASDKVCHLCGHDLHLFPVYFGDVCYRCFHSMDYIIEQRQRVQRECNRLLVTLSLREVAFVTDLTQAQVIEASEGKATERIIGAFNRYMEKKS